MAKGDKKEIAIATIMTDLPQDLQHLKRFHGHLGPYVVVGYRMGALARRTLEGRLKAVSYTGTKPPISCIIDGVQFSSCCTLGKGNILVNDAGDARVQFLDEKRIMEINLLPQVKAIIDQGMGREDEEEVALRLFHEEDEKLFNFLTIERTPLDTRVKLK